MIDLINYDIGVCNLGIQFMGEALDAAYAKAGGSLSYLGLKNSGMWCSVPLKVEDLYIQKVLIDDYSCTADIIPLPYPNWSSNWYNVACRPWYQG